MTLPELSVIDTHLPSNHKTRGYTVEQMLAWGKANAEQEREACAKLCENHVAYPTRLYFAAAIRARGD